MQSTAELNLDGLVGPTHNYAGLSYGNLASMGHGGKVSNPRAAALQGLAKMRLLADLGLVQGVLPPQERPDVGALRALGFSGSDARVLGRAAREAPELLAACASASSMWAANAATVSPSADTTDRRVHLTPANLVSQFHRSLEPPTTERILRAIFRESVHFCVHTPLAATAQLGDEGAANHLRLAPGHGAPGVEVFVYGRRAFVAAEAGPRRFPARQTREASQAVARRHGLAPDRTLFLRQHPDLVDSGVFHGDVIAVANEDVLFFHERAFADESALDELQNVFRATNASEPVLLKVEERRLPATVAVDTYLFNSQLVTLPAGGMALIAPAECDGHPAASEVLREVAEGENPVREVRFVDVRQSMENGGGPACLRLRVVLTSEELSSVPPGVLLTGALHAKLITWVERHYRDRLAPSDLADPALLDESRRALDELTGLLGLGSLYPFQTVAA
jgi:succinylarginine dihydrolase